jgi:hypothetical protein
MPSSVVEGTRAGLRGKPGERSLTADSRPGILDDCTRQSVAWQLRRVVKRDTYSRDEPDRGTVASQT